MPFRLVDIVIDRVDCVDVAANPHASILLWKRHEPTPSTRLPIPNEWRGLMSGKTEGKRLWIEDRHDLSEWASTIKRGICLGEAATGEPEVWVGPLTPVPGVRDADVIALAKMLPTTCIRRVMLCKGQSHASVAMLVPAGMSVDKYQQQMTAATEIRKNLASQHRASQEQTMSLVPSDEVVTKSLDGDAASLVLCRKAFEALTVQCEKDVASGALSQAERNEIALANPGGTFSQIEKAAVVAAHRGGPKLVRAWRESISHGARA